jgi:UDP-2-acetamido-3-amino-2,3-dideoxy-glucuronate N-acetyltransferase
VSAGGIDQASVAVVGCGHWGRNLVRTFAELGALAAVVDSDADAAAAVAQAHHVASRQLAEVLADPAVDAIVIAAPAKDHASLAMRALDAGKHVYVEKPLALEVSDAERVVARAEELQLTLMVGHLLQYHPAFLVMKRLVAEGSLGELRYLYSNRLNLGRFRQEENILWSFAPHDISMLLSLVGEEPHLVTAVGSTYLSTGIPDVTTTHLAFPSGPRAHVFVSWLHPFKEQRLVVVGADSMAVFDDLQPWDTKLMVFEHGVEWEGARPVPVRAEGQPISLEVAEPLKLECQHFLERIADGAAPNTDGHEGLRVLRVLDAAQRSIVVADAAAARVDPPAAAVTTPEPPEISVDVMVHQSAYVDDGVTIGAGTKVWHFSHVLSGSRIGADCSLGQNVVVGPDVTVGDRCRIQNNVSVYAGVTLEDGVFCGPSCVFTNVYNPRAEVSRKDEFRTTVVRRGATIGANATVVCGYEIGEYAFVAAGAVVTSDVPAHALVVGSPARRIGWMSHEGERLGEDLVCPRTGRRYEERDGSLHELSDSAAVSAPSAGS